MRATDWWTPRPGRRTALERAAVTALLLGGFLAFLLLAPAYRWEWGRIWGPGGPWRLLVDGLAVTLWVSTLALALGLVLGAAGGLARCSGSAALQQAGAVYVEVVRGTPFLVQLMVGYYCVAPAAAGLLARAGAPAAWRDAVQGPVPVGVACLAVFAGAYLTEIVRAAIQSVDRGQVEAAVAQGMTRGQVLRFVLAPQALRRMIPPLTGELVSLVKDSSLLSIIAVEELRKRADSVYASTYKTFEVFLPVAVLYLLITFPLSRLARRLETRLT